MAKRYRYSFAKQKPAPSGVWSLAAAGVSFVLFFAAVAVSFFTEMRAGPLVGGICVFAALLAVYSFFLGLYSFSEKECSHTVSTAGAIAGGVILIGWLGIFMMGV